MYPSRLQIEKVEENFVFASDRDGYYESKDFLGFVGHFLECIRKEGLNAEGRPYYPVPYLLKFKNEKDFTKEQKGLIKKIIEMHNQNIKLQESLDKKRSNLKSNYFGYVE